MSPCDERQRNSQHPSFRRRRQPALFSSSSTTPAMFHFTLLSPTHEPRARRARATTPVYAASRANPAKPAKLHFSDDLPSTSKHLSHNNNSTFLLRRRIHARTAKKPAPAAAKGSGKKKTPPKAAPVKPEKKAAAAASTKPKAEKKEYALPGQKRDTPVGGLYKLNLYKFNPVGPIACKRLVSTLENLKCDVIYWFQAFALSNSTCTAARRRMARACASST
jgi:hypothetical protein